jgi:hypothetical protein
MMHPQVFYTIDLDGTLKTVGASTVFAHQASPIGANFETAIRKRICQHGSYHYVLEDSYI